MFGMKPKPVSENEAEGEIERVYHEIRQCMRVTGVNLNFRTLAGFGNFLPKAWDATRGIVVSENFENSATMLRASAATAAGHIAAGHIAATAAAHPDGSGESERYQIKRVLELYDYINPKLLLFTSILKKALGSGRSKATSTSSGSVLPCGEPARMFPMEMVDEDPDDKEVSDLFEDIKSTLELGQINSDYRSLALWPDFLKAAWSWLKPICQSTGFKEQADKLRDESRRLADSFPVPAGLDPDAIKELGEDPEKVLQTINKFEQLLPELILNISLLREMERSPSGQPQAQWTSAASEDWRAYRRLQSVVELGDRFISYIDTGAGDPVILIHGIPSWGFLWGKTIERLRSTYRMIVPDLVGFGYSDKRDSFDRSIAVQADMIEDFLKKQGISSAHVIAHDIGGGVALRLATLKPHCVKSLTVMNTVCYDSWPIEMMLQFGHPAARRKMSASTAITMLKQALKSGFHSTPEGEFLSGLLSAWTTEVGKLSLIRNAAALNTNLTTEVTRLLPAISVPTLIIWGEDDKFQLIDYGRRLHRDIPGSRFVPIAEARHFVMIDKPDEVNSALAGFLAEQRT